MDGRAVDGRMVDGRALDGIAVDGRAVDGRSDFTLGGHYSRKVMVSIVLYSSGSPALASTALPSPALLSPALMSATIVSYCPIPIDFSADCKFSKSSAILYTYKKLGIFTAAF